MHNRRVIVFGSDLRFYEADGWKEDAIDSLLECGQMEWNRTHKFWKLKDQAGISSLSQERLRELSGDFFDARGNKMSPRERDTHIKYYSSHGVFIRGDDPSWYRAISKYHGRD